MKSLNFESESGQGLTEYAVVLSLVAVASIASMAFLGATVKAKVASLSGAIAGQSVSEVTQTDQKAHNAAKEASKYASKVRGTTALTSEDLFDQKGL